MRRTTSADDLIMNGALLGALALTLLRPRHISRIAALPLVQKTISSVGGPPRDTLLRPRPRNARQRIAQLAAHYSPIELRRRRKLRRAIGQRLNDSAAMLALSVLADSAVEHYRGSFQNRAMYTPLAVAALTLGASIFGRVDSRASKHMARDI